jgi:extracellular factor (EF) 3-hydroxypalmitic acid methyl ester biosynthesis protein
MSSATTLLEQFSDADVDWLLANDERHVRQGEKVISAGEPVDAIYLLLEGVLGVVVGEDASPVDVVGPGDIVGEMSLVEQQTPTRSVSALEASTVLVIPHDALRERAEADLAFAARLYRALALLISRRFRRASNDLAARGVAAFPDDAERAAFDQVTAGVEMVKDLLIAVNQVAIKNGGDVPAEAAGQVASLVDGLYPALEATIGDAAPGNEQFKEQVGIRVQRELLPYMLLTKNAARVYAKPRGYAGDYLTIEWMYEAQPGGVPPLGPLLDACLLELPASVAVRNRRGLLAEEIHATVARRDGEPAHITSLACGPAREVFDVFETLEDPSHLKATMIDFDLQALAHVSERRDRLGLQRQIALTPANLIHLSVGRKSIDLAEQDLIYSIGLIDYFPDELVVKLMSLIHSLLRPQGKAILGNFHPSNTCKAFMDHVLEWRLIHRDEADMDRLYSSSAFGRPCTNIRFEQQGINLFAECVKS